VIVPQLPQPEQIANNVLTTLNYNKLPAPIRRGLSRQSGGDGKRRVHKLTNAASNHRLIMMFMTITGGILLCGNPPPVLVLVVVVVMVADVTPVVATADPMLADGKVPPPCKLWVPPGALYVWECPESALVLVAVCVCEGISAVGKR
jgi:hypothetical protein